MAKLSLGGGGGGGAQDAGGSSNQEAAPVIEVKKYTKVRKAEAEEAVMRPEEKSLR